MQTTEKPHYVVELRPFGFYVVDVDLDGCIEPEGDRFINRGTLAYSARHVAEAHAERLNRAFPRTS